MNPRGLAGSAVLIFSDLSLALAVWGTAILIRASWGTSTIAGVLPTNTLAGVLPVAVWVALRAAVGLYPGHGIDAPDELRRQGYATLGALAIACAFLGLHRGQDVSRSVLIVFLPTRLPWHEHPAIQCGSGRIGPVLSMRYL